jgi:hypothetical protein
MLRGTLTRPGLPLDMRRLVRPGTVCAQLLAACAAGVQGAQVRTARASFGALTPRGGLRQESGTLRMGGP